MKPEHLKKTPSIIKKPKLILELSELPKQKLTSVFTKINPAISWNTTPTTSTYLQMALRTVIKQYVQPF